MAFGGLSELNRLRRMSGQPPLDIDEPPSALPHVCIDGRRLLRAIERSDVSSDTFKDVAYNLDSILVQYEAKP